MRFLHTSDLHIGKKIGEISLLEDQKDVLDQIVRIAVEKNCDAVIIAGDIYQRSDPSAESMNLFSDFLYDLTSKGIKVICVSGNHDSGLRLSYLSRIIRGSGVYLSEVFRGQPEKITFKNDSDNNVNFFLLPFIRPSDVNRYNPEAKVKTYDEAVRYVIENTEINDEEINIIIAHQFITGSSTSESEESYIGGLENVDAAVFDRFDYVALGHLHRPQSIGRSTMRYSGTPLKYSISETNDVKSCVLVDVKEKEDLNVQLIPLIPLHDVRDIHGMFREIMMMPYSEDFVRVELNDEDVPPDARIIISNSVFKNMFRFAVKNSKTSEETEVDISENVENRSIMDLFCDFYALQNNGVLPDEARMKVMRTVIDEIKEPDNETD